MATFYRADGWVKQVSGQAVAGAQIYVCTQPTSLTVPPTPLAAIFSDVNGIAPITQPILTDGFGHYDFYALSGFYTVVVANAGQIQQVYTDQTVGAPGVTATFSALPSGTPAQASDILPSVRGGVNQQVTAASIAALALSNSVLTGATTAQKLNNAVYVNQYGSLAAALTAAGSVGTVYVPAGYTEVLTDTYNLDNIRIVIDPAAHLSFGTNGQFVIGSNVFIDGGGATLSSTWTVGNCIQLNSGWSRVELAHLIGPGSGNGSGLVFDGCQYCTINIDDIHGWGYCGVLYDCIGRAGHVCDNNSGVIGHVYNNGYGVLFTNPHSAADSEVQNNLLYTGLVGGNTNAEIQFGDSGTYGAPGLSAQGNMVFGFADSSASSHAAVIFENCSYNMFQGQTNQGSGGAFSATNSYLNQIICPTGLVGGAGAASQIWVTGAGMAYPLVPLPFSNSTLLAPTSYVDDRFTKMSTVGFYDDFISPQSNNVTTAINMTSDSGNWVISQIAGGTQAAGVIASTFAHQGLFGITTSSVSGQGCMLYKGAGLAALGSNAGWEFNITFYLGHTTNTCFRAGFCVNPSNDSDTDGIWVEYDTANASSNTDFTWRTVSSSTSHYSTTNSVAADTGFHSIRIRSLTAGTIGFTIDGGTETNIATDVPTAVLLPFVQILTRTAGPAVAVLDSVSYYSKK